MNGASDKGLVLLRMHINDAITRCQESILDRRVYVEGVIVPDKIANFGRKTVFLFDPYRLPKGNGRNWINHFDAQTFFHQMVDEVQTLTIPDTSENRFRLVQAMDQIERMDTVSARATLQITGLHQRMMNAPLDWSRAQRKIIDPILSRYWTEKAFISQLPIVEKMEKNEQVLQYIHQLKEKHVQHLKRGDLQIGAAQNVYVLDTAKELAEWLFSSCRTCQENNAFFVWLARYYQDTLMDRIRRVWFNASPIVLSALTLDQVDGFSQPNYGSLIRLHLYGNNSSIALFATRQTIGVLRNILSTPSLNLFLNTLCLGGTYNLQTCNCQQATFQIRNVRKNFAEILQDANPILESLPRVPCSELNGGNPSLIEQFKGPGNKLAESDQEIAADIEQETIYNIATFGYEGFDIPINQVIQARETYERTNFTVI